MQTVNALINSAFQRCSLVGDSQAATGSQAMNALHDLQSVISELCGQDLILSDVETVDIIKGLKIKIMAELPENWSEVDELPYGSMPGQVCKLKTDGKVYAWERSDPDDPSTLTWQLREDIVWPDLLINPLPDRIVTMARKVGERYVQLYPAQRQVLDAKTKRGLPTFFACETELETVSVNGTKTTFEVFYIELDSMLTLPLRITYLKSIPQYKLNDKLYFNEKILSILEDGLCSKLCLRYKLLEIKPYFDEEFANAVRLLKRVNQANRPMTYSNIEGGSYRDSFFDAFSPLEWG